MTDAIAAERATQEPLLYASVDYDGTDADDGMVASARDFTADFLTASPAAGRRPVARERVDLARLVVSELVTNAVRHAPGPCRLLLELFEDALEISVFDGLEASPVPGATTPAASDSTASRSSSPSARASAWSRTRPGSGSGRASPSSEARPGGGPEPPRRIF